ncbi:lipid-A-disaccharide synthase [Ignatzschineria indica]|uniref:lipid-A-disaccharide synthase n=1 Tax=Ignatzschineria indica TaxID=472583 RepID=UPI0025781DCF|nr:lipid-A-disaccharide synthase [Ignatzschineria indica]MDM1544998.1 lipid-A-disaccharide synthase [Ignatzschineria indica]
MSRVDDHEPEVLDRTSIEVNLEEQTPLFMLVAGELSGDLLGGGLITSLKESYPNARFFGIGGPMMIEAGLESIAPIESLSIMGLVEVLKELPKLLKIKAELVTAAKERRPLCFIGIDAPDFNLRLAKSLKALDITTFQYVSPSVWVWREGRVKQIRKYIDRVLTLFPFEVDFYQKHQVDSICVGHRLGGEIPLEIDRASAKLALDLPQEREYLAILPGSRRGEINRLLPLFLESLPLILQRFPTLEFLIPAATPKIYQMIQSALWELPFELREKVHLFQGRSREIMSASKGVLLASGTAALEAMLLKRLMVVCYRFNAITAWLAPKIVKISHFSLPNILAKEPLVTELFQQEVTPERIALEVGKILKESPENSEKLTQFNEMHLSLRLDSDQVAKEAVISLLKERGLLL